LKEDDMKAHKVLIQAGVAALVLATAGCKPHGDAQQQKTHFPGMITADGHTSGEVMAANGGGKTNGTYAGGTPGIAGGAGGNSSGAGIGGSTQESGQGPTQGVSAPSGGAAAAQGANQSQSGDNKPPPGGSPTAQGAETEAAHRDPSHSAAPGR
jgi:hypothetical protein